METRKCKDCGREFTLTDGEIEFYKSKGLSLPKRCKDCRNGKKGKNNKSAVSAVREEIKPREQSKDFEQANDNSFEKNVKSNKNLTKYILPVVLVAIAVIGYFSGVFDFGKIDSLFSPDDGTEYTVQTSDTEGGNTSANAFDTENGNISANASDTENNTEAAETETKSYKFRNKPLRAEHYEKHGIAMGFKSEEEYEKAASAVVTNPASLHKIEAEDGDDVYFLEATDEFVIVSTDGYLRTYFNPEDGIEYFERQ